VWCAWQKPNTQSLTEGELMAVNDVSSQIIWTRNLLLAPCLEIDNNIHFQDNRSAILLENSIGRSSTKQTRHIDVR
jgi:hypothetical protein